MHTVWKNEKFTLIKDFFPSNQLYSDILSRCAALLSRNCCQKSVRVNSRNFHIVHVTVWKLREFTLTFFWQQFRESNGFTKEITK